VLGCSSETMACKNLQLQNAGGDFLLYIYANLCNGTTYGRIVAADVANFFAQLSKMLPYGQSAALLHYTFFAVPYILHTEYKKSCETKFYKIDECSTVLYNSECLNCKS
jgi:hypothetical protein